MRTTIQSAALLATLLVAGGAPIAVANPLVQVIEGRFTVSDPDGSRLPEARLIGTKINIGDPNAGGYTARVNAIVPDPAGGNHPLTLYDISFRNRSTGRWEPLCDTGPYGHALAVPMSGTWTSRGRYVGLSDGRFSFSCTSGAHLKCLRMGYAPWKTGRDGESLSAYHQACTRMMRADYCGNGTSYTIAGRRLQVRDRLHPPQRTRLGKFEAVWGADGAVCLRRPRVPDRFPLETILHACPRLSETLEQCDEAMLETEPKALFANRS